MSNQISYEEAIMQLVEMFPKIDIEVIKDLLLENRIMYLLFSMYRSKYGENYCLSADHFWR